MKKTLILAGILTFGLSITTLPSCKSLAKTVVKHWTKKQKKEFIAKCKDGTLSKFGEKTNEVCSCVATIAEEKYPKIEDALSMKTLEIIKLAMDCK